MREISSISCSCGGEVTEQTATIEEEATHGCGRRGCCVKAYVCGKCGTRFTLSLESPEWGD